MGHIKLTSVYTAKKIIDKMKRQPTEWEEILQMTRLIRS